MDNTEAALLSDIENVKNIPIVSTMLEVICKSTGMGFAAIARVTEDRWIACSVRDEISFGLVPGGELKIETTICNEIRDNRQAVIIDHVQISEIFADHHTPKMYGFQSYISIPIILRNGDFFGTLCAIDPKPALLNNAKTVGMFNLFAELIAFHLETLQVAEQSKTALNEMNHKLVDSVIENRQFKYISNHNLQEPLRKMRVFSSMLVQAGEAGDVEKIKFLAGKIDDCARKFSELVKELSEFSELYSDTDFELVDLRKLVAEVCGELSKELDEKNVRVQINELPVINASFSQMKQLFYSLITNSFQHSKRDGLHEITIGSKEITQKNTPQLPVQNDAELIEIMIQDNGAGFSKQQLEKIFDIFPNLINEELEKSDGSGLVYCRKIVRNHGGSIAAESEPGQGTAFSIILPIRARS
ncbi:sensor histidine kinase [Dyadobacter chenhuakuii]|uniref:histidine kinase n=1 Tax=Dyadobacter chenhuakuii TaxID=2909339 RepID=A0A9X1TQQ0_9BACT|nr:ATP-binding protein [Dyadobacter chenhuakuii]MCF2497049.1 ATP-binding protein [Dyadobacter chenhuakuii]